MSFLARLLFAGTNPRPPLLMCGYSEMMDPGSKEPLKRIGGPLLKDPGSNEPGMPYVIPLAEWNQATGNNWTIHSNLSDLNDYLDEHDSIEIVSNYYGGAPNSLYVVINSGEQGY